VENKLEKAFGVEKRNSQEHFKGDQHNWHKDSDFTDLQEFFENAGLSF